MNRFLESFRHDYKPKTVCKMLVENEQLALALGDITDKVAELQRNVDHVRQLFSSSNLRHPSSSPISSNSRSSYGRSISLLEHRIEELERNKRDLTDTLSTVQDEAYNAVRAREDIMRRYRLLIRFSAGLLQRMIDDFPDEEFDEHLRSTVKEDLKRSLRSSSRGTSRSTSITAHPESRATNRSFVASDSHSQDTKTSQAGPSTLIHQDPTFKDGEMFVHNGVRKIPASVKHAAGPISLDNFIHLGFEKNQLEDLFLSLIQPNNVSIRFAMLPSPSGLEGLKLVFLYDPFYLETGAKSYILDWATPQTKKKVAKFLKDNDRNRSPVFQTFTHAKKKKEWYYFGSLEWTWAHQDQSIWSTLDDESRSSISRKLSCRSHGSVGTEEVEKQISDKELLELTIEITSVDSMEIMREIAVKLGQQLKRAKPRLPE